MKIILLTFLITDTFEARTKRLTFISSDKFFENDVNKMNSDLYKGQQIIALDTYTFVADLHEVKALWKTLRADETISWRERIMKVKQAYPDGLDQYIKV